LCDVMMPQLDGYGTISAIRQEPSMATTPFIFLTAKAERWDMRQGMQLGADDYLSKPFTAAELLTAVKTQLDKHTNSVRIYEKKLNDLRKNLSNALPHEFRTPLSQLLGFSEILIEDLTAQNLDEMAETAGVINQSAARLQRLIENFLFYGR